MFELTAEQLAMRELRDAAYHEAGHKSMCRHFGGDGDAIVWKNLSGNPDERAWLGQFRTRVCPQRTHDSFKLWGFPTADLPPNWRALFGVAGLVAEEILRGEVHDAELVADAIDHQIFWGEVSATDLASMGIPDIYDYELNREDVEQAWHYLKSDWSHVQEEAEYLIAEALMK